MVSHFPFFLLVPASLQVNTLAELVAYVKARPGQVSYASNGSGLISHLGMEMLKQATGMDLLHVPYKGFAPALPDLLSGRVAVMMADLAPVGQQLRAGSVDARSPRPRRSAPASCPRCPRSPNWATRATRSTSGSACSRRRRRRPTSSRG